MTTTDPELMRTIATAGRRALALVRPVAGRLDALALFARDGYPTSTPLAGAGTSKPRPDDHEPAQPWTPTERAALNPSHTSHDRTRLANMIVRLGAVLDDIEHEMNRQPPEPVALCDRGVGRAGAPFWANPDCREIPDERCGGLGLDCFARMNAWRIDNGLPAVERQTEPMCKRCGIRPATVGRTDGLCAADRMKASRANTARKATK